MLPEFIHVWVQQSREDGFLSARVRTYSKGYPCYGGNLLRGWDTRFIPDALALACHTLVGKAQKVRFEFEPVIGHEKTDLRLSAPSADGEDRYFDFLRTPTEIGHSPADIAKSILEFEQWKILASQPSRSLR